MKKKEEEFVIREIGTYYRIPKYRVHDGEGIRLIENDLLKERANDSNAETGLVEIPKETYVELSFVRGAKDDGKIPRVDGLVHEQLLGMMIYDLGFKNTLVPSRETAIAIRKLEEALMWLNKRSEDRERRDVQGTYKN